jgi:hypothetical protein
MKTERGTRSAERGRSVKVSLNPERGTRLRVRDGASYDVAKPPEKPSK